MIRLIRDKEIWCEAIKLAQYSDFYHTYDYHQLSSLEDESPVLIDYTEGNKRILLPLLTRTIPGTDYKDATSVYGYAGPLGIGLDKNFDNTAFKNELVELFNYNHIVTVFSRLNPFVPFQGLMLRDMGVIDTPGKVVYIDLKSDQELQWAAYNRRLKSYINKSRREYSLVEARSDKDIMNFIEMYLENMRRLGADKRYFFNVDYFFDLIKSEDITTQILMARRICDNQFAGGALFIKKNEIVQYHLSGAREDALKLNPIKVLIDEMRARSMKEGYKYLNLGGGVGNNEDSLFYFKSSFSKEYRNFNLWKFVVDKEAYNDLIINTKKGVCVKFSQNCNDFFPCYRCDKG